MVDLEYASSSAQFAKKILTSTIGSNVMVLLVLGTGCMARCAKINLIQSSFADLSTGASLVFRLYTCTRVCEP